VYFPDFWTRPYTIAPAPPLAHAPPRLAALRPLRNEVAHAESLSDSKIPNEFNSKKRFFNDIKDLEDIEY
jgi:hypothetical protein